MTWWQIFWSHAQNSNEFFFRNMILTILFVVFLVTLHYSSPTVKKWVIIALTFLAGLLFTLEFFLPPLDIHNPAKGNIMTPWVVPSSEFIMFSITWMLGLGVISLFKVHLKKIMTKNKESINSYAFFVAMIAMIIVGFASNLREKPNAPPSIEPFQITFNALYQILQNLDTAMFALLAFYITSAAYRAFRIRTAESALLMISALIIMISLVSLGAKIMPADVLDSIQQFLFRYINMSTLRAITIGVSVGALAMSMRIWLSLERGSFFSKEQ
jgi:hypothetical protein